MNINMIRTAYRKLNYYSISKKINGFCFVAGASFLICVYVCAYKYFNIESILLFENSEFTETIKYVLIWTDNSTYPFKLLKSGRKAFREAGCDVTSCYVTSNSDLLSDIIDFDAVLFHGPELLEGKWKMPKRRSSSQKYVFASVESADNYPVCDAKADNYFNWTWTYKLDSDEVWSPITIRNFNGEILGPRTAMVWIEDMLPVADELKRAFTTRKKAAAWFVSNCATKNTREVYVDNLMKQMKVYNMDLDIFGGCGHKNCSNSNKYQRVCDKILREDYFFYLAFENSFSDDYVTEKALRGYRNHVVPIVFGSANYARFLPPNSYLNAFDMEPKVLAEIMHRIISRPELYHQYFRWTNHYIIEASESRPDSNQFCRFCAALHDPVRMDQATVRKELRLWWNGPTSRKICALEKLIDLQY